MKKILLVEDDGVMTENLKRALANYNVIVAKSYDSATDRWEEEKGNFCCIIIDLLIYPKGLRKDQQGLYSPLFGMALINNICNNSGEAKDDLFKRIIVYSGFSEILKTKSENSDSAIWDLKGLTVINKDVNDSIAKLVTKVNLISER